MKCPKGAIKRRVSQPHGQHSHGNTLKPYKHSLRGHTWKGNGNTRVCGNCGTRPRHMKG